MMDEDKRLQKAKDRVEEIKGFYTHLFMYILVNIFLFIIDIVTSPGDLWFYWPLFGWGIGIVGHAVGVFGLGGLFGEKWEERKIKEIMKNMEQEREDLDRDR